ncbi:hypothetical protein [Polycladidibacter hongkongensis]|uniref:hypothetical protein n=1 Tax=Polycladidibacter hongkongensis TaxID=1647556 RepID=UPI0012E3E02B|nr:hypothetical protein [Pseudovibrio hongkongensis]
MATFAIVLCSGAAHAADLADTPPPQSKDWEFTVALYGLAPWISGDVGVGPAETSVNITAKQVFDALSFAAFADAQVTYKQKYSVATDLTFANFQETFDPVRQGRLRLNFKEIVAEGRLGYRVWQHDTNWIEAYTGVRYWYLDSDLAVQDNVNSVEVTGSTDSSWADPILGAQANLRLYGKWRMRALADVGGFGVGSDFSYRLQGGLQYQFDNGIGIEVDYKALYANYENGEAGAKHFIWDTLQNGVLTRLFYNF